MRQNDFHDSRLGTFSEFTNNVRLYFGVFLRFTKNGSVESGSKLEGAIFIGVLG